MTLGLSNTDRVVYLGKLKIDLQVLNSDSKGMLQNYLSKAGLKTSLVATLTDLHTQLQERNDQALYRKFTAIKRDFSGYLDSKMAILNAADLKKASDPWLVLYASNRDPSFLQASEHIQDVLFATKTLLQNQLAEGIQVEKDELHVLVSKHLREYIELIQKQEHGLPDFSADLVNAFESFEAAVVDSESTKAMEIYSKIQSLLQQEASSLR